MTSVPSTTIALVSVASIGSPVRLESEPTADCRRTASVVPSGIVNSRNFAIAGSGTGVSATTCTSATSLRGTERFTVPTLTSTVLSSRAASVP